MSIDFGAAGGGIGVFGLPTAAVDGLKGGGYGDAMGAMHEGARNWNDGAARNLAHQAKIREAQEYLRQQNAQKQQQRLGLAHPPQLQYQPPPPPPPPLPPPPAVGQPPPPQSAPPPNKRDLAQMVEGGLQHSALPSSVQQAQLQQVRVWVRACVCVCARARVCVCACVCLYI